MIHHINRIKLKADAPSAQVEEALESLRNQGRQVSSVKSFVVGRDHGGDFDWGATYVIEDLDGLWEYLTHPATLNSDKVGLPVVERLDIFDISDDEDPELAAKIEELHRRRNELSPETQEMLADVPAYLGAGLEDDPKN
jgi:hypothetical protein